MDTVRTDHSRVGNWVDRQPATGGGRDPKIPKDTAGMLKNFRGCVQITNTKSEFRTRTKHCVIGVDVEFLGIRLRRPDMLRFKIQKIASICRLMIQTLPGSAKTSD